MLYFQRLSNGSIDPDSDVNRVIELQETVEKQNSELTNTRTKMLELNNKLTEIDESYTSAQKDLIKAQEQVVKLQRDLREVSRDICDNINNISSHGEKQYTYCSSLYKLGFPNFSAEQNKHFHYIIYGNLSIYRRVFTAF